MEVRLLDDRDQWNYLAVDWGMGNILQSYEWGEFKALCGWQPVRLAILEHGRPLAAAQMLLRPLPLGTVAYVPRGPLFERQRLDAAEALIGELHRVARQHNAIFLKVEPETPGEAGLTEAFQAWRFAAAETVQPRSTIICDLTPDIDTVFGQLNAKTRYNIRLASRRGITVEAGSLADVDTFYHLLLETSRRSDFQVHNPEYYRHVWETLHPRGIAHLMLAKREETTLAAAMLFVIKQRAYYMYSASASEQRNLKPNELLQWECIKLAKSLGCASYDMWGIPDEVGEACERGLDPDSEDSGVSRDADDGARTMLGVYRFKRGFGGQVVRFMGAYDYVYSPTRYRLYLAGLVQARSLLRVGRWSKLRVAS